MNYVRVVLAAIAATVVVFIYGFLAHGMLIAKTSPIPSRGVPLR